MQRSYQLKKNFVLVLIMQLHWKNGLKILMRNTRKSKLLDLKITSFASGGSILLFARLYLALGASMLCKLSYIKNKLTIFY